MKNNCKYMKAEPNYTPNNFDINFNYTEIPSNINIHNVADLDNALTNNIPLTKKIHLQMDHEEKEQTESVSISCYITAIEKNNNEINQLQVRII